MHDTHDFLRNLALVLCVAGATTVIFQRLRQPVIFGYLLAGLLIGPHLALPLVADSATIQTLAELGVLLVMFSLGLEFSIRKIIQVAPSGGLIAVVETSTMMLLGYLAGQLLGWTTLESVFAGAIVATSSTTIIIKAFEEQGIRGRSAQTVFAILIGEDLIAILLLAVLTTVAAGGGLTTHGLANSGAQLLAFLAALVGIGLLIVPRLVRYVVRHGRPETILVMSVGICFAAALLALAFGYSVALGAFIAGALVAESGQSRAIEHFVHPVRDLFAAIFFVAVGMLIDPVLIAEHWLAVVVLTLVVVVGKVVIVSQSAFLAGNDVRTAVQTGLSLAQIGEFSFIIAGVGLATGAARPFLYPVAIAVSAVTTLTTPILIRASGPLAMLVDRKLPRPLQTFVALYGSWVDGLRSGRGETAARSHVRRAARLLLLDAALLAALLIGLSLEDQAIARILVSRTGVATTAARLLVLAMGVLVAAPLLIGIMRNARLLGVALAVRALPHPTRGVDFAEAPRRVLISALQFMIVLLVGTPLVTVTLPFLPGFGGAPVLIFVLGLLAFAFWRSARNLQGHARAGAHVIATALEQQMATEEHPGEVTSAQALDRLHRLLPGLGEPVPFRVEPGGPAADRSLAELNLRGLTGATVLAILRDHQEILLPVGTEIIRAADVLAVAGSLEAIDSALQLLRLGPPFGAAGVAEV